MIKFYEKHKKGIKIIGAVIVIALVVTILLNGTPSFNVNP
jgi:hypothetical protein